MRNSRPSPKYRNIAEHWGFKHFDSIGPRSGGGAPKVGARLKLKEGCVAIVMPPLAPLLWSLREDLFKNREMLNRPGSQSGMLRLDDCELRAASCEPDRVRKGIARFGTDFAMLAARVHKGGSAPVAWGRLTAGWFGLGFLPRGRGSLVSWGPQRACVWLVGAEVRHHRFQLLDAPFQLLDLGVFLLQRCLG